MSLFHSLLFLHIAAVVVWVGGMAVMQLAVRPAAAELLEPPLRLPFMALVLGRFFSWVSASIAVLLVTGGWMMHLLASPGRIPLSVHAMLGLAIVMIAIFGHVRFAAYPRLRRAIAAKDWPLAATHLATVRRLVWLNLAFGVLTIAAATIGAALL